MLANEYLSNRLFPLKKSDSVQMALEILNESNVAFLPVVDGSRHLGYICTADIMDVKPKSKKIDTYINTALAAKIYDDQHLFEIVKIFAEVNSTVISVVNHQEEFVGIIAAKDLIKHFAQLSGFSEAGSIITLEMGASDYSLSEIARLVEYNNAKVLSVQLSSPDQSSVLQVHVKLNTRDIQAIRSTFERYNYKVVASYFNEDDISGLKSRYDQLMKYLDL
ncbi:MAG: CBS domain-containing protein [Bacteroidetes bacterium]|nr:MAG: CBS domain-containing protein [Bacteroidota bacterium]